MGAGSSALGFGGGFAKGFANALLLNTERKREDARLGEERKFREFQVLQPTRLQHAEETGDWAGYQEWLTGYFPDLDKQFKKGGSPFENLAPLLQRPTAAASKMNVSQDQADAISAGDPSKTVLPSRTLVSPATPPPPPDPKSMFFGSPMPTPEQKAERQAKIQAAQQTTLTKEMMDRARTVILPALRREKPTATIDDALRVMGVEIPVAASNPRQGVTLSPGQIYVDETTGKTIATGAEDNKTPTNFDAAILAADARGDAKEVARLTELKRQAAEAGRKPDDVDGADPQQAALARLAARNPAVLQGLTPTVTSAVLGVIASDPTLMAQYENTRMAPIREQTKNIVDTMGQLLEIDPTTGKVIGLTDGAKWLYGGSRYAGKVGAFINPGGAAATAQAALDQITGQVALDLIAQLKAQSRTGATGFGQMNLQELALLEASASVLKGAISEEVALSKLTDLYEKYQKILAPSAQEVVSAAGMPAGTPGAVNGPAAAPGADGKPYKDATGKWIIP